MAWHVAAEGGPVLGQFILFLSFSLDSLWRPFFVYLLTYRLFAVRKRMNASLNFRSAQ